MGTLARIDWQCEALQKEKGWIVMDDQDLQDIVTLNRLEELLLPRKKNHWV